MGGGSLKYMFIFNKTTVLSSRSVTSHPSEQLRTESWILYRPSTAHPFQRPCTDRMGPPTPDGIFETDERTHNVSSTFGETKIWNVNDKGSF